MSDHLLIAAIDERLIAIGLSDTTLEIVLDDQLRESGKELEGLRISAEVMIATAGSERRIESISSGCWDWLGGMEIFVNDAERKTERPGDLALRESGFIFEPEQVFGFAHRDWWR